MRNIMLNNRQLRALGLGPLTTIMNATRTKTKVADREYSGSLYQLGDEDDVEQGVVDEVYAMFHDDYSFVLIMQNYLFGSTFFYHVGGHAGLGT